MISPACFPFVAITVALAALACESPIGHAPPPAEAGEWFVGDEATAEAKRSLERNLAYQETLKGPRGAELAAKWGLTLEAAITAAAESVGYYEKVLRAFSGEAQIARLEDELEKARAILATLEGPGGPQHATDLGMTVAAAKADVREKIESYSRSLAAGRRWLKGRVDEPDEPDLP